MIWISTFQKFALIISLVLIPSQSFAQNYELFELEKVLITSNTSKSVLETIDIERLRSLIYDLHPTIYFEDQQMKTFEDGSPVKAEIYSNSISLLTDKNMAFPSLELLQLKFNSQNETSLKLDLSSLNKINKLRFIYIECSFNCDVSALGKMFSNLGEIKVFYQITAQE